MATCNRPWLPPPVPPPPLLLIRLLLLPAPLGGGGRTALRCRPNVNRVRGVHRFSVSFNDGVGR